MEKKIKNLIDFAQGIYNKENGKELYEKYKSDINTVTPQDIFLIENEQLKMGLTSKEVLVSVDKLINVFYESLIEYEWEKPVEGTFIYYLMEENEGLRLHLDSLKVIIKKQDYLGDRNIILESLKEISVYNEHLQKLENILFPYMEKKMDRFEGLKIMWSLHDDVRNHLKELIKKVEKGTLKKESFNIELGTLYYNLYGLINKQELILFPAATGVIEPEEFIAMHLQSFEYEFAFIEAPEKSEIRLSEIDNGVLKEGVIQMETGKLTFEQIEHMINAMPIDVTFVDKNNKVAFFSRPNERIFKRSVAIIGRDVKNCHPPESVHVVEKILENFKAGEKNSESFWLQMKGMFILIQYFAVRNDKGDYLGTLEVSQEISNIRSLEGEKRILDK
jgi:DUF438 domain-containing protein